MIVAVAAGVSNSFKLYKLVESNPEFNLFWQLTKFQFYFRLSFYGVLFVGVFTLFAVVAIQRSRGIDLLATRRVPLERVPLLNRFLE